MAGLFLHQDSPMSDRKPASVVLPAVALVLVLFAAYVGAYYWAIEPLYAPSAIPPVLPNYPRLHGQWEIRGGWQKRQRCVDFFDPIHRLDRRLRPHAWGNEPNPNPP